MTPYTPPPKDLPLPILHIDDDCLVVDKPSGLLSVPGRGPGKADCLAARLDTSYPGLKIVHRLDMETSGLMIFARHSEAQRALSKVFADRMVKKTYEALVDSFPSLQTGKIDLPLAADWPNRPLQKVDVRNGKPSVTHWQCLEKLGDISRFRLNPITGRSHQLRVHMVAIGHAILGDRLYAPLEIQARAARLCLHATALTFPQPRSNTPITVTAPAPF